MRALLGRIFLVGGFFPSITLSISCHSLLDCRVSAEKSANNLTGVPLYVTCFFSLAAFKIFSLSLNLTSLITMYLSEFLLGFIFYGTCCASWIWVSGSFPMLGKVLALISSNIFYFKVYFVWYEYCYSSFLLIPVCMEYFLPSSHFQFVCVPRSEVGLLKTAYIWVLCLYPFSQSMSFGWGIYSINI